MLGGLAKSTEHPGGIYLTKVSRPRNSAGLEVLVPNTMF